MSERHRKASRASVGGALGVAAVLVLAGALFAANARISGGIAARQPQDLAHLVGEEVARSEALAAEVDALRGQVDALADALTADIPTGDPEQVDLVALAAGRVPVTGPGLTVRLTDAPLNAPRPDWATNDDLVVHQQDLQAVINALWAGGAEAMTLQGERVVATSAYRCVGNVLWLHGKVYSPPYVVRAVGDPDDLREVLERDRNIQEYLRYVDALGLGWSVSEESELRLPAYEGNLRLTHADVPDGVDVLPVAAP